MTRREVLAYTLAPAAAATGAAAAPSDRLRLGHIGVGIRGTQLMGAFAAVPGVESVMAADLYDGYLTSAKERTEGKIATTKDYRAVLDNREVDAVVIATPDHWHKRMVLDALAAGKHVYIEKPMTLSLEEGPEMVRAAERSGKVVQVGSGAGASPLTAKAREVLRAGTIGEVMQVRLLNHRNNAEGAWVYPVPPDASEATIDWARFLGSTPKKPFDAKVFFRWRCWWEYSGGVATDLFVHLLTLLHRLMDVSAPASVVSMGGLYRWKDGRTVPDLMQSVFEYEKGFIAEMCVNLDNGNMARGVSVYGTEGTLWWDNNRVLVMPELKRPDVQSYGTLAWPKAARAAYFKSHGWSEDGRAPAGLPGVEQKEFAVERGLSHQAAFAAAIREGKPPAETAQEGHLAAGAAHLANMAFRQGRKMKWDSKTNRVT